MYILQIWFFLCFAFAAGAGAPYPTQPPYNPAYMDPQKPTY